MTDLATPDVTAPDVQAQLQEEVAPLATRLLDRYNGLDAKIAECEARITSIQTEIAGLRKAKSYLRNIVRDMNPELIPVTPYKKNGKKPPRVKHSAVGAKTMQTLTDWLQAHREELNANGGFRGVDLTRREDFTVITGKSNLGKALSLLHDGGALRLDRWVRGPDLPHRHTGKFYKVI